VGKMNLEYQFTKKNDNGWDIISFWETCSGAFKLKWDKYEYPVNSTISTGFLGMKCRVYDAINFIIDEDAIYISVDTSYGDSHEARVCFPNTPETLNGLEVFIKEAKKLQKPIPQEEKIGKINFWKRSGYIK